MMNTATEIDSDNVVYLPRMCPTIAVQPQPNMLFYTLVYHITNNQHQTCAPFLQVLLMMDAKTQSYTLMPSSTTNQEVANILKPLLTTTSLDSTHWPTFTKVVTFNINDEDDNTQKSMCLTCIDISNVHMDALCYYKPLSTISHQFVTISEITNMPNDNKCEHDVVAKEDDTMMHIPVAHWVQSLFRQNITVLGTLYRAPCLEKIPIPVILYSYTNRSLCYAQFMATFGVTEPTLMVKSRPLDCIINNCQRIDDCGDDCSDDCGDDCGEKEDTNSSYVCQVEREHHSWFFTNYVDLLVHHHIHCQRNKCGYIIRNIYFENPWQRSFQHITNETDNDDKLWIPYKHALLNNRNTNHIQDTELSFATGSGCNLVVYLAATSVPYVPVSMHVLY